MQRSPLSDLSIKAAKPPTSGYVTLWDGVLKGFGVIVTHTGTRSFCVLVASGRRKVIGKYPLMSLADARKIAREMLADKTLKRTIPTRHAFEDAKTAYLEDVAAKNKPRTLRDYQRLLDRHYDFGRKNMADISPRDIIRTLKPLSGTPSERHHAYVAGKVFFRWCVRQQIIDRSPMENLPMPSVPLSRHHTLSDDDLAELFKVLNPINHFHAITLLLIYTGQRRSEIAALEWDWIHDDLITLPETITKNKRAHTFPIGKRTQAVLQKITRKPNTPYVFPAIRHIQPTTSIFNGWSKAKVQLHSLCPIYPWALHDLRRTFATNMQRLGIKLEVTESLLNHISGSRAGIVGIYQRYHFLPEMRDAILRYDAFLDTLSPSAD